MSGNDEKNQTFICSNCKGEVFSRYFRDYGVAKYKIGWQSVDYDYYDMDWDDDGWRCADCGQAAPEDVCEAIEERM